MQKSQCHVIRLVVVVVVVIAHLIAVLLTICLSTDIDSFITDTNYLHDYVADMQNRYLFTVIK